MDSEDAVDRYRDRSEAMEESLATNGEEEHSTATESRGGRRSLEHCSTVAA
jgi:hypothetical protein